MTANIIAFPGVNSDDRHISGKAHCLHCGYEWEAVAPEGTTWLACPECTALKGIFKYPPCVPEGGLVRECQCGNQLFYLTPEGHLCPMCGTYQAYD